MTNESESPREKSKSGNFLGPREWRFDFQTVFLRVMNVLTTCSKWTAPNNAERLQAKKDLVPKDNPAQHSKANKNLCFLFAEISDSVSWSERWIINKLFIGETGDVSLDCTKGPFAKLAYPPCPSAVVKKGFSWLCFPSLFATILKPLFFAFRPKFDIVAVSIKD